MSEERIREIADNLLSCIEEFPDCSNSHYRTRLNYAIEHIKAAIKESSEEKDEVIRKLSNTDEIAKLKEQIDRLLNHCSDPECGTCGEIVCPFGDDFHFHHDRCPSCAMGIQVNGPSRRVSE